MAGVLASLNVKVGADISAFRNGIRDVNSQVRNLTRELDDIGRSLTRGFTVPIGLAAGASIKMAGDFEKSMNRVRALTGATGQEFDNLRSVARRLGSETQFSATQAAEGLAFLAQAGFQANEAAEALPGVLNLAAAGALELGEAADIASNIMSGFALEVSDLSRLNDVLAKTFTSTNTNLQQLGEAFQYVGPIASSAGLSIEETAAALGLLGNAGIQGSAAGTALRGILSRLLSPAGEAASILRRLGINAVDSSGQIRDMADIVDQLRESGATTADLLTIFGDKAGPGMAALVSQGAESLRKLTDDNLKSLGTAAKIAETQMEGFNGQMTELRSAAEGLAIAIGEAGLLSRVTKLAERVTGLVQNLSQTNPEILNTATNIGLFAAAMGPALIGISSMIKAVGTLRKAFILLNTFTFGLVGGLSLIGAIAGPLYLGISQGIKGINKEIRDGAGQLETLRSFSGPGQGAYNLQIAQGLDRSAPEPPVFDIFKTEGPYSKTAKEIKDITDMFGIFGDQLKNNVRPWEETLELIKKNNKQVKDLDKNLPLPPPVDPAGLNQATSFADALEDIANAATRASRAVDLDRLSTPRLGDITTARERISTDGLSVDPMEGMTASQKALADISTKVNENLGTQIGHWRDISHDIPAEAIYAAAEAFSVMAQNMQQVAAAGGTFREVAAEIKRSAISIIGDLIRVGVTTIITGTLKSLSFTGPLAIAAAGAAGALAQGLFNSVIGSITVPAFADGGLAFGPTLGLFGEYQNAANNPEVIAPLDKLKNLMGGTNITVNVTGKISGRDIQLATERNNIISSRLKGR